MTVIVALRKGHSAVIASDRQISHGEISVPGAIIRYPNKILAIDGAYIGLAGNIAHQSVLRSLIATHPELFDLSSAAGIFETFRRIHPLLRSEYHLLSKANDEAQEYESNHMEGLVISPGGVFSFLGYREVTEYGTYWAAGSGSSFALGALDALYAQRRSARAVAEAAVATACKFDTACGPPIESYEITLQA
ncbi:MAG: hypothetical protein KF788_20950 [Piscinibacter sp.]|nr:hypothetical protein [Piscinibacter sp.]